MWAPVQTLLVLLLIQDAVHASHVDVQHGASTTEAAEAPSTDEDTDSSTRNTEDVYVTGRNQHPVKVPGDHSPEESTNNGQPDLVLGDHEHENIGDLVKEDSADSRRESSHKSSEPPRVPGAHGAEECPPGCWCSMGAVGKELRAECALEGGTLVVAGGGGRYELQCESQSPLLEMDMPEEVLTMLNATHIQNSAPSTASLPCSSIPPLLHSGTKGTKGLSLAVSDCAVMGACDSSLLDLTALSLTDASWPLQHMTQLRELGIYHHREANLTLLTLSHLSLESLTVNGQSLSLPMSLPRTLERLELSNCGLRRLDGAVFDGLDRLQRLYLHGNGMEHLGDDVFTGLSGLVELGVSSNALTKLPVPALEHHCPQLTAVSAFDNAIAALNSMRGLTNLTELELFYNRVPLSLSPAALSFLPKLTMVDLRENGIRSVPEDLFEGSPALKELNLAGNELTALPPALLLQQTHLQTLDLSSNQLQQLPPGLFSSLGQLSSLRLAGNKLAQLPDSLTGGLSSLRSLWLSDNALRDVTPAALGGCPDLTTLALNGNQLSTYWVHPGVMDKLGLLLNGLRHLEVVDLSSNRLTVAPSDVTSLVSLRSLDLSRNNISDVTDLNFLSTDLTVDLRHNNISSVLISPGVVRSDDLVGNVVLLDDNPFVCDCWMYNAVRRSRGWSHPYLDKVRLEFGLADCTSPLALEGTPVASVREEDLLCHTDSTECVKECACAIRPFTNALELQCDSVPQRLPARDSFGVTATELTLRTIPPTLTELTHIRVLNISGLGMKETPSGDPPDSLRLLDMSNNSLDRIPVRLLKANLTVKLSRNPFQCDCWFSDDLVMLQEFSAKVMDYENVTCDSGEWVGAMSGGQLCAGRRAGVLGGCLAALGVLAVGAAVLLLRYRVEMEILLTRAGLLRRQDEDDDKEYDAFVSYAYQDEDFVFEHLIPKLEGGEGLKLCIHSRDWQPGEWISSSIAHSVANSRRTLLLLSRHFLSSRWGRLEFQAAVRETDGDRRRVVVLLLEDVSDHPDLDLDPELKAYLRTNTYVKWGDPWFWRKLLHALPARKEAAVRQPVRSVCAAIPPGALLSQVARTQLHPADIIMAANKLNGNGQHNVAFTKQEELCDKLTDKLPKAIEGVHIAKQIY